ncbi:MAG: S-adenosylmethionine:tRNA ribosyltransferase-isomerase [Fibrobacteres bacterium]|nr:S-adenosylmethionine:tRNA ribosyltransferase-isomerase [Fibrobacterota bacterium]
MVAAAPFRFELPDALLAREPPEKRGLERDQVRLLAADRQTGALKHTRFDRIGDLLRPGDCLVFNASRTLPAALRAVITAGPYAGRTVQLRLARGNEDGTWSALPLTPEDEPWLGEPGGARLEFRSAEVRPQGNPGSRFSAEVVGRDPLVERLWRLRFSLHGAAWVECLSRLGSPVRYWYSSAPWDLDFYQTVYAREPGSMEMPSAGRAFSWKLLLDLRRRGIGTAFLVLHAGLSSYLDEKFDAGHPASVEPYRLEAEAAARINAAKETGGRIVAVGTTVVRALETMAGADGRVSAGEGRTCLRITPSHRLKAVDGLLTGFHEPQASHLDLLSAFLPPDKLKSVYDAALEAGYLWHEFGDANLIL